MTTVMKNGVEAADPRLGRVYEEDWRSLNFLVAERIRKTASVPRRPRSFTWTVKHWLDQGFEGACVGFGFSHDAAARPALVSGITNAWARMLYFLIQILDPWPGGAYPGATEHYEGTSVLTGAKVMTKLGYYLGYDWAMDAREAAEAIAYDGPGIFGFNWHRGMANPDANGFIHPTGPIDGGHCILGHKVVIVYKSGTWLKAIWGGRTWDDVDFDRSYIVLWNSWGPNWGDKGTAKLTLTDLDFLIKSEGDACFPRRNPLKKVAEPIELDIAA